MNEIAFVRFENNEIQKRDVKSLWSSLNALDGNVDLEKRLQEIKFLAYRKEQLIGVSSAVRVIINQLEKKPFFNFRILVNPKESIPGLLEKLSVITIDWLEDQFLQDKTDCIGLVTLVENPEYKKHRRQAVWPATGFVFVGKSAKGHHVRVRYFKGAVV